MGRLEHVLAARRAEMSSSIEDLRHLGPQREPEQVFLIVDEVLTRKPTAGHFLELRTARIMTGHGYRSLSGVSTGVLQRLQDAMFVCQGPLSALLLIADGAGWIRSFFIGDTCHAQKQDYAPRLASPEAEMLPSQ